ncbi:MAG: ATP-grasp domain-containing protein, partial [Myxococcota bacterium]
MNVHEYQAKALLREFGVAVPEGALATTPAEAAQAARALGSDRVVVKAQIHAGGRGKGGGIKLAATPEEAEAVAAEILGMTLVTHQTGPEGKLVRKVYVEEASEIETELYLAMLLDRASEKFALIASTEGGMDIEVVAAETPEKILTELFDPNLGLRGYQVRRLGFGLGLDAAKVKKLEAFAMGLYRLFVEKDASLVEINPLVVTKSGDLFALDGKLNFDDNALYR